MQLNHDEGILVLYLPSSTLSILGTLNNSREIQQLPHEIEVTTKKFNLDMHHGHIIINCHMIKLQSQKTIHEVTTIWG